MRKIGVLDSGAGGLTVLLPLLPLAPAAHFLYVADTSWCPYGAKDQRLLELRIHSLVRWLVAQGCCMIVVACNTATAVAIRSLRASFTVPFIGMEPAVKPAAFHTKTGHIGVLATEVTLKGELFRETSQTYAQRVSVHYAPANILVQLVEEQRYAWEDTRRILQGVLAPLLAYPIDHLVLGCTHFPYLKEAIRELLPDGVQLVDPAPAVARRAMDVYHSFCPLEERPAVSDEHGRLAGPVLELVASGGDADSLEEHLRYYAALIDVPLEGYALTTRGNEQF